MTAVAEALYQTTGIFLPWFDRSDLSLKRSSKMILFRQRSCACCCWDGTVMYRKGQKLCQCNGEISQRQGSVPYPGSTRLTQILGGVLFPQCHSFTTLHRVAQFAGSRLQIDETTSAEAVPELLHWDGAIHFQEGEIDTVLLHFWWGHYRLCPYVGGLMSQTDNFCATVVCMNFLNNNNNNTFTIHIHGALHK